MRKEVRNQRYSHFSNNPNSERRKTGTGNINFGRDAKLDHVKDFDKCVYDINPGTEDILHKLDFKVLQENPMIAKILSLISEFEFNIFDLRSITSGNELVVSINYLMEINDFYGKLDID